MVLPGRKQILRQVDARHVIVMRSFGEKIQDVLILPAITHQVVQHENAWSQVIGEQGLNVFSDALVEMNPFSVAVHNPSDGSIKSTGSRS